jgi:hypothetical protein
MRRSVAPLLLALAMVLAIGLGESSQRTTADAAGTVQAGTVCLAGVTPDQLSQLFVTEPGGIVGADYQRATPLSNGSVLWTFQDAEVRLPNGSTTLVHNIGMVQRGNCFTVLMSGTAADPQPWLFASNTTKFAHWYWPLGAEMGVDGRVYVFMAEMVERGPGYLTRVEPIATVVAGVDIDDLEVEFYGAPANAGPGLYGWSIESDGTWTYLYAQCHRQFGFDPYIYVYAHDTQCSSIVTVARVPRGQLLAAPRYWTGSGWSWDPAAAVPVIDTAGRMVNASQIMRANNNWMAITKVGDWWGDRILVEQATRPTGPFRVVADIAAVPKCAVDCNTYFASWIPSPDPTQLVFGLSHNRWDGIATDVYRPTFGSVAAPAYRVSPADRCALGYCG